MENAIEIYKSLSQPPKDALKQITGGKLSGKTDINPQWRYEVMTEKFGLVGIGWKYEIQKLWIEQGSGSEKLAFAQVAVFVKIDDKWSEPIVGIGGSKLVQIEKGQAVSNDEGYKMAVTDAFSTALKMIGVAADIYAGRWDGSKYKESEANSGNNNSGDTNSGNFNSGDCNSSPKLVEAKLNLEAFLKNGTLDKNPKVKKEAERLLNTDEYERIMNAISYCYQLPNE